MLGKVGAFVGTVFVSLLGVVLLVTLLTPAPQRAQTAHKTASSTFSIFGFTVGGVVGAIPDTLAAYNAASAPTPHSTGPRRPTVDLNPHRPGIQRQAR